MTDFYQPPSENVSWEEGLAPNETGGFLLPDGSPALNVFPIKRTTGTRDDMMHPSRMIQEYNTKPAPAMLFGYKRSTVLIVGAIAAYLLLRRS